MFLSIFEQKLVQKDESFILKGLKIFDNLKVMFYPLNKTKLPFSFFYLRVLFEKKSLPSFINQLIPPWNFSKFLYPGSTDKVQLKNFPVHLKIIIGQYQLRGNYFQTIKYRQEFQINYILQKLFLFYILKDLLYYHQQ